MDYKVPGGKLLRIDADVEGKIIKSIKISGDFFLYPEEKIVDVEKALAGEKIEEGNLRRKLGELFRRENIRAVGFGIDDLVKVLVEMGER